MLGPKEIKVLESCVNEQKLITASLQFLSYSLVADIPDCDEATENSTDSGRI